MDDATLIAQVQAGKEHANRYLIERYKNLVWHMVLRMVSQPEDAEDLCQEIFLRIFRDIGKFRGESKLSTWIGEITGMPDGTIKSYLNRGRQAIREQLVQLVPDLLPVLAETQ